MSVNYSTYLNIYPFQSDQLGPYLTWHSLSLHFLSLAQLSFIILLQHGDINLPQEQPNLQSWRQDPRPAKQPVEIDMRELGFENMWTLLPEETTGGEEQHTDQQAEKVERLDWTCDKCESTFNTKKKLNWHKYAVHSKPVQCDLCQNSVAPKNLKKHKRTHQQNQFCCSQCGKFRSSAERLNYHEKVCGQERRNKGHIPCAHCQKNICQ